MGVPKFYRWLSERYTKINEIVSDSALLPEFDHLYLDMNGIIHGCTHPNHMEISDVLSERDMMLGIMHYLDRIITQIVKPRVSVYMAIDGVAPRAKLNQQRSRRFRSAKDMAEATKDLSKQSKEDGSPGAPDVFDSNCITPGTEFMAKVSDTIKYFIRKKIREDPIWRHLNIIFSGHEIPGEGEHKIMEHIRMMRNQPGYQPNTRHCIYGQDADLIMLGLVTHEPHFTILREVVDFTGGFRNKNTLKTVKKFTKESDFQLLHLSVLREYLYLEFCKGAEYDLERTIDDFVFMTFLVGNDFLPHLSTLDIGEGAFDLLFKVYKEQRPDWGKDKYLTQNGDISDPQRLENFLEVIGSVETEVLEQRELDDAAYVKKKRKWNKRDGLPQGPSDEEIKAAEHGKQSDYLSMMEALMAKHEAQEFVDGWTPVQPGQKDFKGRYYFEKLKLTPVDIKAHHDLRQAYIEGLMWCLAYYYRGCISWGWFYPYHYGPMLSDLRNLAKMFESISFEVGKPVLPFQQLMACLPPASAQLVPAPYRYLMKSPDSPIIDFYPVDFAVDMNGKKNPWEGVNLLPFIDIERLSSAITEHCPDSKLTPMERDRNQKGKIFGYMFDLTCTETIESPNRKIGLVDIVKCNSSVRVLPEYKSEGVSFKPELIPGTRIPFPGFPSLNVLPIASEEVVPIGVNCFGMPSKYPTMVLKLHEMPQIPPVETLADNVLGKSLFINWPMMHEAKLAAISDVTCEVRLVKGKKKIKRWNKIEADRWSKDAQAMMQGYYSGVAIPGSGGIQIGEIRVRLKLLPLQGMKTNPSNGSSKKLFGKEEADVPLQLALWQAPAPDPRFAEKAPMTLQERFAVDGSVILTKGKYRGCRGTIVGIADEKKVGVKVETMPPEIPFGLALARSVYESYITSTDAARILKLNGGLFGKITGSILFEPGKYDLGLNLKSGDGLCVAGYTRQKRERNTGENSRIQKKAWDSGDSLLVVGSSRAGQSGYDQKPDERIQWEFTPKAIRLVNEYRQKFPQLFTALVRMPNEKKYDAPKVFGQNGADWLPVIREWLNGIESAKLPRTPISTDTMSQEAVVAVEKAADVRNLAVKKKGFPKESLIKIPGGALFLENSIRPTDVMQASDYNDSEAPELGDRIVNLCATGIPFGARGTIVGIHQATTGCVEVVMDEEFVGGTSLQGLCSNFRGKLCVWAHVMKITVDNSKGLVEKMVPQGSGKAAVEKILADIEREVKGQQKNGASGLQRQVAPQRQAQGFATPTRGGSAGRPRADSTSRGKLALSREAKGPPEKGTCFMRAAKSAKGGLHRWRELMKGKTKMKHSPNSKSAPSYSDSADASAGLKAMLGVSGALNGGGANPEGTADVSAGLKAMLGVGGPSPPSQPPNFASTPLPPQPPVPSPATAADKLMQLMTLQPQMQPVRAPSSFNFSYVEEGKDVPKPPPAPQFIPQFSPYPMPPQPMFSRMSPPVQAALQPQGNMNKLSDQEFPPLGGRAARLGPQTVQQTPAAEPKDATLVPSSTLIKPGKGI